jgi:hypothetical protein
MQSRLFVCFLIVASVTPRLDALTRADIIQGIGAYRDLAWTMNSRNAINRCSSPTWTQTPFSAGSSVTGEAYNWGGFSTPSDFRTGIAGTAYAGNRCTSTNGNPVGLTPNTVGVDCSGFLARLWQLSGRLTTNYPSTTPPSVRSKTVAITGGFAEMRPGDVFLLDGSHVAVFVSSNANGPVVAEAVGGNYWRVTQHQTTWSVWKTPNYYEPRRYASLQDAGIGKLVLLSPPTSIRTGTAMTVQATIRETIGSPMMYDEITVAILADGTNAYQFDLTHLTNVGLTANQTLTVSFTGVAPTATGTYRAVIRGRMGSQWMDLVPVPPAVNSVRFSVTR